MFPELCLFGSILIQCIFLVFPKIDRWPTLRFLVSGAAFIISAAALIYEMWIGNENIVHGILTSEALFRIPRIALFFASGIIVPILSRSTEIPQNRRTETLLFYSVLVLVSDILLLSNHLAFSFLILGIIQWTTLILLGMCFRGRQEGEATMKQWFHGSQGFLVGFISLICIAYLCGGLSFESVRGYMASLALGSGLRFTILFLVLIPYFVFAGLFPFHFSVLDRDQGAPWFVQSILSGWLPGVFILSIWRITKHIFPFGDAALSLEGLITLQWVGILSSIWFGFYAIRQANLKKFYGAIIGLSWSLLMIVGAGNSNLVFSVFIFGAASLILWGTIFSYSLNRNHDAGGGQGFESVKGLIRRDWRTAIISLAALVAPLALPGFPGFPSLFYGTAAIIEQKNVFLLFFYFAMTALFIYLIVRILAAILFEKAQNSDLTIGSKPKAFFMEEIMGLTFSCGAVLVLGVFSRSILESLTTAAKFFLN